MLISRSPEQRSGRRVEGSGLRAAISPSLVRRVVQTGFALACAWSGFQFHAFYLWATDRTTEYVARPASVEGFLPISALLGFRRFVEKGLWDDIHPAGLTIFLAALISALLFRKAFCGYVCPVGALSNILEKAGRRLGLTRLPPRWLDVALGGLKYVLLAAFLVGVGLGMDAASVETFIRGPFNLVSDARMLEFFLSPSGLTLGVLTGLGVLSLVVPNAWCRYFCPYGALLGLLAMAGPLRVKRDAGLCVDCKRCERECPSAIPVWKKEAVRSPDCVGCMSCLEACPAEGCLRLEASGVGRLHWIVPALGAVCVMLGFWLAALWTGHWNGTLPPQMLKRIYSSFLSSF